MHRRPYFFEVFTAASFLLVHLLLIRIGFSAFIFLGKSFLMAGPAFVVQALVGIGVRALLDRRRGGDYLCVIRTPRFLTDVGRMIVFSVLWVHSYGWLKIAVPLLHHRLYDETFWNIDRTLFFGFSPNVFFLDLFSHPLALRAIDWTYANVFLTSLFIGGAVVFSSPDPKLRIGFVNANATMWIIGSWLYLAFPTLAPAYRFPSVWLPLAQYLPQTQFLQRLLMTNYQNFLHIAERPAPVSLLLGIGAFPSLHTAYEFLLFLFLRGVSRWARLLFGIFTLTIFIGSIVTGWHYLVDAVAGMVLAGLCYAAFRVLPERFHSRAATD